ncbi:hypothetical protein [Acinetobacter rudis]|uniref:hypothetical protein n=1 Tax=Acinetobacter rudis TaxID=632955 RepID=UPI00333F9D54
MKNKRKVIYFVIMVIVITLVAYVIFARKSEDVESKERVKIKENISSSSNTPDLVIEDNPPIVIPDDATPAKWTESIILINDNSGYSREDKTPKLLDLLKQMNRI